MSSTASDATVIPARPKPGAPTSTPTPAPASKTPAPAPKTPLSVDPTAHLDPHAYIQGQHLITLGPNVLIHPRARLVSTHCPLTIAAGSSILERCVIGGPAPDPKNPGSANAKDEDEDEDEDEVKDWDGMETKIGMNVMVQAGAEVKAGAEVRDASVLESQSVVERGCVVGTQSKVCAGCTVTGGVGNMMVQWGDGQKLRMRLLDYRLERTRLRNLATEREATTALLKAAAAKASLGKRRG